MFEQQNGNNFYSLNDILGKVKITKLYLLRTGTYNEQYLRPYNSRITKDAFDELNQIANKNTQKTPDTWFMPFEKSESKNPNLIKIFDPVSISSMVNPIIEPTAVPEARVEIANGWDTNRIQFMLEIETAHSIGGYTRNVVCGYTDYDGITNAGAIDPNMTFYINSVTVYNVTTINTITGPREEVKITEATTLMFSNGWGIKEFANNIASHNQVLMRPQDIFVSMGMNEMGTTYNTDGSMIYDTRIANNNTPKPSNLSNNSPAEYMCGVINAFGNANIEVNENQMFEDNIGDGRTSYEKALLYSREKDIWNNPFIKAIANNTGRPMSGVFNYEDLVIIDSNTPNVTIFANSELPSITGMPIQNHIAGQTCSWQGSDIITHKANTLSLTVNSIIMRLGITKIHFTATNNTIDASHNVMIINADSVINSQIINVLEYFKLKLINQVLQSLSFNNEISYSIEMNCNLLQDTWIKINLNNSGLYEYVVPNFCSSLTSPVVTYNSQNLHTLANNFNNIFQHFT